MMMMMMHVLYVFSSFNDAEENHRSHHGIVWSSVVRQSNGMSESVAGRINQGVLCCVHQALSLLVCML